MEKPKQEIKMGAPEWVVTFGDMMSLLLTFFVLILSFSSLELDKFKKFAGIMREGFGVQTAISMQTVPMGSNTMGDNTSGQRGSADSLIVLQQVRETIEQSEAEGMANVEITDRGVVLRVDGDAAFSSGSADLSGPAMQLLGEVAKMAGERAGKIEIEGHTDDVPISSARYPSNWELSSARAGAAARHLVGQGFSPTNIKAIGYADTRPLTPNDSAENRAKNRRIEILFVTVEETARTG